MTTSDADAPLAPHTLNESPKRYHEFDALRGFAMLLGIVLHGLLSFVVLPIWPAQDIHQNSAAYGFFQHAIHGFRMPVFFLISGFFTAMMWRKRGAKGLLTHRAKRVLLPLILGTIVLWPLMIAVVVWGSSIRAHRTEKAPERAGIWAAAKQGDLAALQRALQADADINGRDALTVSPLEWAAIYNHPEAIAWLVEHGADVNGRNPDGSTPLHAAAFLGRTAAARKLVELGADPSVANHRGDSPLAAAQLDMAIVRFLAGILQVPVDASQVIAGKQETTEYLENLGAKPSAAGDQVATQALPEDSAGHAGTLNPRTAAGGQTQWLGLASDLYLAATFIPVFHHLWFLYYLLWLVGLFLIAVWIRRLLPRRRIPRWMIATPGCLLWLIPLTLVPQLFMTQTFGADTATGLLPWLPKLAYYAIFFGFGALCFGRPEFEAQAGQRWALLLALAFPSLLVGLHFLAQESRNPATHVLICTCAVVYAWLMVFALTGFFRQFFTRENPRIRYLSDASYWLYLAHLPLILVLQVWVSNWKVHHFPKFLLVCLLTFALLILMYAYLVRYTWVGTLLNGKKTRPAPATREA